MSKQETKFKVELTYNEIVLISSILDVVKDNLIESEDDPDTYKEDYENWLLSLDSEDYETLCKIVNLSDRIVLSKG